MASDPTCVFCRIIRGEIPAHIVHRDEACVAFLDAGPLARGHLLVVPAEHYLDLAHMPAGAVSHLAAQLPKLGEALLRITSASGFNVLQNNGRDAGQVVQHVHFHLIPRNAGDGLGYRWNAGAYAEGEAQGVAEAYRQALQPA